MNEWVQVWEPFGLAGLVIGTLFVALGYTVRQYTKLANHHSTLLTAVIERNNAALGELREEIVETKAVMVGVKDALNRMAIGRIQSKD